MIGQATASQTLEREPSVYPKNGEIEEGGEIEGPIFPLWRDEVARANHEKPSYFKLVRVGESMNLGEARYKLFGYATIPDRSWLEIFAAAYPSNGINPVGIAEVILPEATYFPYLDSGGNLGICLAHFNLYANWLWLVAV